MRLPRLVPAVLLTLVAAAPAAAVPYDVQVMAINGDGTSQFSPCGIGGSYVFPTIENSAVGQVWNVDVDMSTTPWTIGAGTLTDRPPCVGPGGPPPGAPLPGQSPGPGMPGPLPGPFGPGMSPGPLPGGFGGFGGQETVADVVGSLPGRAFGLVATIRADAFGFSGGRLSATVNSVSGLPPQLRGPYSEAIVGQDAIVLVGRGVKVRGGRANLDDAEEVTVKGKLLRPGQWREDEDGNQVPTFRAKRVAITA